MTPDFMAPGIWALTQANVVVWVLVLVRMSGLLAVFPGLGQETMPIQLRVALALLLAIVIAPVIPRPSALPLGVMDLAELILTEFAAGLLMGLLVAWIYDAVAFAGQLMDTQMGFAFVQLVDPASSQPASVSGALLLQVTLVFIFISGLHHQMILALVESYRILPIGKALPDHTGLVVALMGQMLVRGLQLAFPILITAFFVDVLEGVAAKIMPQLQLIQLSFPIKIAVGVTMLALLLREFAGWLGPLLQQAPRAALRMLS
jgi:flagellar biosynthesis protein FliR